VDVKGRSRRASQASQAVAGLPQIPHHRSHSRGPPQAARLHYAGSPTDRGRSPSAGTVSGRQDWKAKYLK